MRREVPYGRAITGATRFRALALAGAALIPRTAAAQDHTGHAMPMPEGSPAPRGDSQATDPHAVHAMAMQGMDMPHGPRSAVPPSGCFGAAAELPDGNVVGGIVCHPTDGSGTSRLPALEGGMHGLHVMSGDWMLMAHGYAWGVYTDQGGPRGDSQASVLSMAMLQAERPLGSSRLQLRAMLSLDPLMGARGYPLLLASGETAGGAPLVDRQHPHDAFMELTARVDVPLSAHTTAFLYGGPVGEPALGPSVFMMRGSARFDPEAPIGHHWFDSTHISYGVVTAGLRSRTWQLEGSAFRGREPDEQRWDIETPRLDSWSVRATWTPDWHWAAELSFGRLESPEALHPNEDETRLIASVHYASDAVSAMAGFVRKERLPGPTLDAWLAEATWHLGGRHNLFGRAELVDNDELLGEDDPRHGTIYRVARGTVGYAYTLPLGETVRLSLGGSGSIHLLPGALEADYGRTPLALTLFAKLSLGD